ncbi:MAG: cytochrome P450, partial [Nevskiales bacterium]
MLDPLTGRGGFDFVRDLSAIVPMQVIGMLLGIPEQDRQGVRERADARLRTQQGQPMQYDTGGVAQGYDAYID